MKTKLKNLIFERGWMFSKEKLAVASANWFSGRWLYYNHFSLKNNLLTSCSTFMFQEKEEDLHVLQFGLDCQKVGGETVVQRFSWTLQRGVQAEHRVVGRSCWADRVSGLTLSTCVYLWHLDTTLSIPGRGTNPIVCRCKTVVPICSARLKSECLSLQKGNSH